MPKPNPTPPPTPKFSWKSFLITTVVILTVFGFWSFSQIEAPDPKLSEISLSEILTRAQNGELTKLEIFDQTLVATFSDESQAKSRQETFSTISDLDIDPSKTEIIIHDTEKGQFFFRLLGDIFPFILIFGLFIFLMRRMSGGGGIMSGLTGGLKEENQAEGQKSKITFRDVAGVEEPKAELVEVVDFLKKPRKYLQMGAKIPKGVLLVGPPGTGKTLLAKAVAGEAGVPFFSISGSEFEEMFVGVGASRARTLFDKAKKVAPSIIFIDELDAIGKSRAHGPGQNSHSDQTLNQILVEMDGFGPRENVIVLAATNRPDVLDPALLRPGRFDRRVVLDLPSLTEREAILDVHARGKKFHPQINFKKIADTTAGFSGADLENLLNESAITAVKNKKTQISNTEIDIALEKIVLGLERKSRVLSKTEKAITAFHEAGHALIASRLPAGKKVRKISIMSRGRTLGATWIVPEKDTHLHSKQDFEAELASLLGGRLAEKQTFKSITTGAANDLERATQLARAMVIEFGMSDLGLAAFSDHTINPFIQPSPSNRPFSESTATKIDQEINKILRKAEKVSSQIIRKEKSKLKQLADALIKKEILIESEVEKILGKPKKK